MTQKWLKNPLICFLWFSYDFPDGAYKYVGLSQVVVSIFEPLVLSLLSTGGVSADVDFAVFTGIHFFDSAPQSIGEKHGKNMQCIFRRMLGHVWGKCLEITDSKAPGNCSDPFWTYHLIFMTSGFSDVSSSPKTNYVYLWRHHDT